MSGPFLILASSLISRQELSAFAVANGGTTTSDITLNNVMSRGADHVWFGLSDQEELEAEKEKLKNGTL